MFITLIISLLAALHVQFSTVSTIEIDRARAAFEAEDYALAVPLFLRLAKAGNAEAQFYTGFAFAHGHGVTPNDETAVQWYRLSADQEFAPAQFYLSNLYREGRSVDKDNDIAFDLLLNAADQGYARAQFNLGGVFLHGIKVAHDYDAALDWYNRAAEQDYLPAQLMLGILYGGGFIRQIREDHANALKWRRRAAEQGSPKGQYLLANTYRLKGDDSDDRILAYMWYDIAALDYEKAVKERETLATLMPPEEILKAQELVQICLVNEYKNCGRMLKDLLPDTIQ